MRSIPIDRAGKREGEALKQGRLADQDKCAVIRPDHLNDSCLMALAASQTGDLGTPGSRTQLAIFKSRKAR